MAISATDVKRLRDATGAGMMDAKNALIEAEGDAEKAVELLRIAGLAKAAKRADRQANNGLVTAHGRTLIQLAAETDFVAKNAEFIALADEIARAVDEAGVDGVEAARQVVLPDGSSVEAAISALAARIGEKLELAAAAHFSGDPHTYLHRRAADLPPQVGVMALVEGGDDELGHNICMQIASMSPQWLRREDIPEDVRANEAKIAEAAALEDGKPAHLVERIVEGAFGRFVKENCLVEQAAIWHDKAVVGKLLDEAGARVVRFVRFSAAG